MLQHSAQLPWQIRTALYRGTLLHRNPAAKDLFDTNRPKGYVYFAMAFSVVVEILNLRLRKRRAGPVELRVPYAPENNSRNGSAK